MFVGVNFINLIYRLGSDFRSVLAAIEIALKNIVVNSFFRENLMPTKEVLARYSLTDKLHNNVHKIFCQMVEKAH